MSRSHSNKRPKDCPYVGKGGLKLRFGLDHFGLDVQGMTAIDLGCNVGGFTDCLLQAGASKIYAVDTSYGLLAWKLRIDERVVVHERTNVLHWSSPELFDFAAGDMGWTKQELALPVIAHILKPGGQALSLVKPQYESPKENDIRGVLPVEMIPGILESVIANCPSELEVRGTVLSPYIGRGGNTEALLYVIRR